MHDAIQRSNFDLMQINGRKQAVCEYGFSFALALSGFVAVCGFC